MACDVVAHIECRTPQLAKSIWGERRGCFEKPHNNATPKVLGAHNHNSNASVYTCFFALQTISIPELAPSTTHPCSSVMASQFKIIQEHSYSDNMIHPVTGKIERYVVGDRFHEKAGGHKKASCKFHNIDLCPELKHNQTVTSEVINSKIKSTRLQSSNQQNLLHYFLYNRLMDYWHNRSVVEKQRENLQKSAKPGETVVRDMFHRFIYSGN